ncbi:MAG: adenylosuccinate synthetase [Polyangiaceae bacterium]|nr:adenylosuccinate synthetase [Polyangiaceae bacterium]
MKDSGAVLVVDLGFGDGGKGLATDYFARLNAARRVLRFNGGAQAGHNVVLPDGRHHTFSQFAAASFLPEVETVLLEAVVLHPTALLQEASVLEKKGVRDPLTRLSVEPNAKITTPFHQAAGRMREKLRSKRHGSCGVGFGETIRDALHHEPVRFRDLGDTTDLRRKTRAVQERLRSEMLSTFGQACTFDAEFVFLEDLTLVDAWVDRCDEVRRRVRTYDRSKQSREEPLVFEGAQGVLIDENFGFAPHTTWSNCTFHNAETFLRDIRDERPSARFGVIRSYAVRHGEGPLPSEVRESDLGARLRAREKHNVSGTWQGEVRVGAFDVPLFRYALQCVGKLDGLLVTHLDAFEREIPIATGGDEPLWGPRVQGETLAKKEFAAMLTREGRTTNLIGSHGPTHLDVRPMQ